MESEGAAISAAVIEGDVGVVRSHGDEREGTNESGVDTGVAFKDGEDGREFVPFNMLEEWCGSSREEGTAPSVPVAEMDGGTGSGPDVGGSVVGTTSEMTGVVVTGTLGAWGRDGCSSGGSDGWRTIQFKRPLTYPRPRVRSSYLSPSLTSSLVRRKPL